MYILYVDESGDTGPKGSKHLLLGGGAIFEGAWSHLQSSIDGLNAKYFSQHTTPVELHCAEIRGGRGAFSQLSKAKRTALLADFSSVVASQKQADCSLFTVVMDKSEWRRQHPFAPPGEVYIHAFEQIVSRFDLFLKRMHALGKSNKGIVVVDYCSTAMVQALRSQLSEYQSKGTRWASLFNVVETVLFLASHESPGLQVADLTAYSIWRLVEYGDDSLVNPICGKFDREPQGASQNPGKWHGVKYVGVQQPVRKAIRTIWP